MFWSLLHKLRTAELHTPLNFKDNAVDLTPLPLAGNLQTDIQSKVSWGLN